MSSTGIFASGFVRRINSVVAALQSAPGIRRFFTVITYTGRRSGRTFSTPVNFSRRGDVVSIWVGLPERKSWWRNFTGNGGEISLRLDGTERTGHAIARKDDKGRVTVTVDLS
ncbi:DUF385 domain-containing protein [Pseudonocardiaceae bacterium YIM PH 21723]|nr:DUF385 domain-containing protein [Pseudonocardiaceae bacterium YIM PH 21723]